jgi:hypothetical protein
MFGKAAGEYFQQLFKIINSDSAAKAQQSEVSPISSPKET